MTVCKLLLSRGNRLICLQLEDADNSGVKDDKCQNNYRSKATVVGCASGVNGFGKYFCALPSLDGFSHILSILYPLMLRLDGK